jgi:hypothetical protein
MPGSKRIPWGLRDTLRATVRPSCSGRALIGSLLACTHQPQLKVPYGTDGRSDMVQGHDATTKKKCFVLSPIGAEESAERKAADVVLKHLIMKALGSDFDVERADESTNPGSITPTILAGILEADLIVADLSGLNPNVFYELAMAHGYAKPTVHIQKAGEPPPFDVKDMRIVPYNTADPENLEAAQKRLLDYATFAVHNPEKVETPLTSAARFTAVQESTDPVAESNVRVTEAIAALHVDVKRALGRRLGTPSSIYKREIENNRLLKSIVERIVSAGRAEESDFDSVISPLSSPTHDRWFRRQLSKVMGTTDAATLNEVLFDDEVETEPDDDGYEPDEATLREIRRHTNQD